MQVYLFFDQTANYAPLSANVISQATIQGTDTDVLTPLLPAGSVIAWGGLCSMGGYYVMVLLYRDAYPALFAIMLNRLWRGQWSLQFQISRKNSYDGRYKY